jgi:flagellar motility protein MotE (MotC chaperone)
VLTGATKDMVKSMPKFEYATDTSRRDRSVAKAEQDIAVAKSKMVEVEKKAATATGEAKTKMDKDIAVVKQDMKSAEDKLVQLNKAGVKHWKEFEADVSAATARLRKWVDTALS